MKVVALVSGGKDSCYNILKCHEHGHEVVALANLHPRASGEHELDSYCFQTVGHNVLHLYPQCFGLPLYRRVFTGISHQRGLDYTATEGDEVEELCRLLAFACAKHPDIKAVSSGAIASDYQRVRVEHVCSRLGLVSLAYMWHQPQAKLLRGMVDAGLHSIIIKVACLGLDAKHLGRSIAQIEPVMLSLAEKYGCNVCGEGGEFETLTLDGPMFTLGRIKLTEHTIDVSDSNPVTPVASLRPITFQFVPKENSPNSTSSNISPPFSKTADTSLSRHPGVIDVPDDWTSKEFKQQTQSQDMHATHACSIRTCGNPSSGYFSLQTFGGNKAAVDAHAATLRAYQCMADMNNSEATMHARHAQRASDLASELKDIRVVGDNSSNAEREPQRKSHALDQPVRSASTPEEEHNDAIMDTGAHQSDIQVTEAATGGAVAACLQALGAELVAHRACWKDVIYVHMFLANMAHFAAANKSYMALVPQSFAPSRACVALPLPPGILCSLDISVAKPPPPPPPPVCSSNNPPPPQQWGARGEASCASGGAGQDLPGADIANIPEPSGSASRVESTGGTVQASGVVEDSGGEGSAEGPASSMRRVMHVQSHSEWAPASIGPYSQATVWGGLLHIAGQLPLDAASMQVKAPDDVIQCMHNCAAVATALGCHLPSSILSLVSFHTSDLQPEFVLRRTSSMHGAHARTPPLSGTSCAAVEASGGVFPGEESGDSYRIVRAMEGTWDPINLCVQVPALPRVCAIELQPLCAVASSADAAHACDSDSEDSGSFQAGMQDPSWTARLQSSKRVWRLLNHSSESVTTHTPSLQFHIHSVYSPSALLVTQIGSTIHTMHAPHACESHSEESGSSEVAVEGLRHAWQILEEAKHVAGVAACAAWTCRLFVTPEISKVLNASREEIKNLLSGATVNDVSALHDGDAELAWVLRAVVAQY